MQRISRDDRIYVLDPKNKPVSTIDSGEELIVETWDAFEGVRDPEWRSFVIHAAGEHDCLR